ncbi:M12 family metallopeptidase [Myxococcus sp. Y35]|uniref:M12 family metallopeptidase n=1 Tax=Pseudomyxococcus flavus TaxID=3115648 RepID=UPI003CF83364
MRLIRQNEAKWANGTVLHYYFFDKDTDGEEVRLQDGSTHWMPWTTTDDEKKVVREAFRRWKEVGIGLEFEEVTSRSEAEIRIGFMRGDGAWSYVGRDVLRHGPDERTMNFGWDLTESSEELDTAIHEIGHTLGFPHEHQNPHAGIVWDEEAVYADLAKPPNRWSRETTFFNIIRKLDPSKVEGSTWDPDSVMHYPFKPGLIKEPKPYFENGLTPKGGISNRDKDWVKRFYPPLTGEDVTSLQPFHSETLALEPGQQRNFSFTAQETREYQMRTFGTSDTVMVLFEKTPDGYQYLMGSDDSGQDVNASLKLKLFQGREYALRVRLYYEERAGESAVMLW